MAFLAAEPKPNPVAGVDYTGDLEVDSRAELDELYRGFRERVVREYERFKLARTADSGSTSACVDWTDFINDTRSTTTGSTCHVRKSQKPRTPGRPVPRKTSGA
jgi:hypothetical protein